MDLTLSNQESANLLKLPVEIIIQVLSYLEVCDLYNIAETCQSLNHIINNEELWKNLFIKSFHTNHFSSISNSYKFSVELLERNEILHRWRKSSGIHKIFTINTTSIKKVIFSYPKVLSFSDQGDINISSIDKGKTDIIIPMTTPVGCTSYSFNNYASVFGRIDGKIYGKLLASKSYLSSMTEFNKVHEGMVTSVHSDDMNCYSGDENGNVFTWDLKNGEFLKEYKIGTDAITNIKGHNGLITALSAQSISIIENDRIKSIVYNKGAEFFDVDFGGKIIIVGNSNDLYFYSYQRYSFGRVSTFTVGEDDEIWSIGLENKRYSSGRDLKIAGYDGCNFGIVTKIGRCLTFNFRDFKLKNDGKIELLQPQCEILPSFDTLKIPNGIPPISSISINSAVVLLGSYNGFAAVYDVLTGAFIKLVSNRIPKRYLPLTQPPYLIPVRFVELSPKNQTNGILIVNNVVQYFQFGKALHDFRKNQKKKKSLAGVASDRKDKIMKKIKSDINELYYEEDERYKQDRLLDKYNGNDLTEQEEMELAMVLNHSINESKHKTGEENDDIGYEIDEELSRVLELSMLENQGVESHHLLPGQVGTISSVQPAIVEPANVEDNFEKQLQEALKRSLYE